MQGQDAEHAWTRSDLIPETLETGGRLQLIPARQLESDLWLLDLDFQRCPGVVAAYLVTDSRGHTLIETGPGSTLPALERAVAAVGARLGDITQLLVTHIHLDHAGSAGSLLGRLPDARLFVHPLGVPHMVDPSKLIASATRIYGDRMGVLWGAFEPCPADRVVALEHDAELRCGTRTLRALHTPGHASHHIAFHDPAQRTVFTGDVGGVRLRRASYVRPPTPPPDIDIELWHQSVSALRAVKPRALDLTHFGRFDDPSRHLDELLRRLDAWTSWTAGRLAEGLPPESMAPLLKRGADAELMADGADPELVDAYELATPSGMTVNGLVRFLMKRPKAG